ncbi:MAG: hypothetical protein ABIH21_04815 [Patescibacteria group bacterium]
MIWRILTSLCVTAVMLFLAWTSYKEGDHVTPFIFLFLAIGSLSMLRPKKNESEEYNPRFD